MMTRLLALLLLLHSSAFTALADDAEVVVLTTDRATATDGYWNTDQGYFVSTFYPAGEGRLISDTDPAHVMFRIGYVPHGRLIPGETLPSSKDWEIIGPMWLVIRDGDQVLLRVPTKAEHDGSNYPSLVARFNAIPEMVPKMEIEFEQRLESGTRRMRVPFSTFMG